MEQVRNRKEHTRSDGRTPEAGARLDRLIGQLERQAVSPSGTALDAQGHAPQATCSRFIYCV